MNTPQIEFGFESLKVWQRSIELVDVVYDRLKEIPVDERFELRSQLRRAVVSVPTNIAEGHGRATKRDYAHFVSVAHGSLMEVVSLVAVANRREYFNHATTHELRHRAHEIGRMLNGLRSYLLAPANRRPNK